MRLLEEPSSLNTETALPPFSFIILSLPVSSAFLPEHTAQPPFILPLSLPAYWLFKLLHAAADSPQWRRGPADAPVLCNACGTRFRRTSQLSSGGLRALKRAAEAQRQQQLVKHPKVNTLVACTV